MDFFEVLIILIFVIIPILEGVFKQRRKKQLPRGEPAPRRPAPANAGAGGEERGGGVATADEGFAADMVPPELWEVLTGERRPKPARSESPWEPSEWSADQEAGADEITGTEDLEEGWSPASWEAEAGDQEAPEPEYREAVSLEYVGPEAISLEQPPPPAEIRHAAFHAKYDAPAAPPSRPRGGIGRELRAGLEGAGLRRSILLAEILGPPKGLI